MISKIFKKDKTKILILIIILAILIRSYFYIGFIDAQPQDEIIYYKLSLNTLEKGFEIPESDSGPRNFRLMTYLPVAFFYKIFGVNKLSTSIYLLLCSIGSLILIYLFGKEFFNEKTGIIGAFLFSIFPLNIIYSTRIVPDIPMAFFSGLSVFFFLKGIKNNDKILIFFSGVFLGLVYLTKIVGMILIGVYIIYMIFLYIKGKFKKEHLLLFVGFLLIFTIEGSLYQYYNSDFLLHKNSAFNAISNNYHSRPVETIDGGIIKFKYVNHMFLEHSKTFFNLWHTVEDPESMINYFGFFYYFIIPSIIFFSYNTIKKGKEKRIFFMLWFVILFLFLEFGFTFIETGKNGIEYFMMYKRPRYLSVLTIPALIMLGYSLSKIKLKKLKIPKKYNNIFIMSLLFFLFVTSIFFVNRSTKFLKSGTSDLENVYDFIKNYPEKEVYTDDGAKTMLEYYFSLNKEINILYEGQEIPKGSYIIIGGGRSLDIIWEDSYRRLPQDYKKLLKKEIEPKDLNLKIVKIFNSTKNNFRGYNATIYETIENIKV